MGQWSGDADPAKESKDGAGKAAEDDLDEPTGSSAELKQNVVFKRRVGQAREPVTDTLLRAGAETGRADGVPCNDRSVLGQARLAYVTIEYSSDDQAAYGDLLAALSAADDVLELSELAGVTKLRIKIAGTDITTISER